MKGLLADPEGIRAQVEAMLGSDNKASELEGRLEKVEARLKALSRGEEAIARQLRQGILSEDVAARELKQGQQERAALERERDTMLGQLETARRYSELDIEGLCARVTENLGAPTPEIIRLAFEALGVKVTVKGNEALINLALPIEEPHTSGLQVSRRGG